MHNSSMYIHQILMNMDLVQRNDKLLDVLFSNNKIFGLKE